MPSGSVVGTNADGLLADLDLPPAAYWALPKLRARSEAGGRIAMDQATLGALLGLSRPSVPHCGSWSWPSS
ncbi:hypothetical protein ACIOMM_35825 [Streptomyces sp. NPDC087908]|uniref:hypothetical protein n=1 Tax=Streptomyces sp. NPDC087908 TaxID=3365820 RepID=UPI00382E2A74